MTQNNKTTIIGLVAFAWIFGLILLFYASHKPFTSEIAASFGISVYRVTIAAIILGIAGGIGNRINNLNELDPLARLALQCALGMGILGIAVLVMGITIGVNTLYLAVFTLLLCIIFWKWTLRWYKSWSGLTDAWRETGRIGKGAAISLVLIFTATLVISLAPPVKYDALVYHLALPQAYLNNGRVSYLSGNMMSGMPQTGEMLYTWAMGLAGLSGAAVLGWCFGAMAVIGTIGYTRKVVNPSAGWVAGAFLVSGATLAASLSWGYIDWLVALWGMCFLVSMSQWVMMRERRYLILAAVYCGMAIGTKYPAGLIAMIGIVIMAWVLRRNLPGLIRCTLLFGVIVVAVTSPWLAKNFITTSNPFYPILYPSGAMTSVRLETFQHLEPWGNWMDVVFLPVRASTLGREDGEGYSFVIGPLLFGFGLLAWLGRKYIHKDCSLSFVTAVIMVGVGVTVWAIGNRFSGFLLQTRMYLSIFPALAFLASLGFEGVASIQLPGIRLGRMIAGITGLVLLFNTMETGVRAIQQNALQYLLGMTDQAGYLQTNMGWYEPAMQAIKHLPEGSSTLLLVEPRSLYCSPACQPDETLDRWKRDLSEYQSEDAIIQSWKQAGYTNVLFFKAGEEFLKNTHGLVYTTGDWEVLERLLAGLPLQENFGETYYMYRLP